MKDNQKLKGKDLINIGIYAAIYCVLLTCVATKTPQGARIYAWRKETIERSFAEAKENHGLRFARMLGIQNMREQCFLTAAVQNMKRLAKAFCFNFRIHCMLKAHVLTCKTWALSMV